MAKIGKQPGNAKKTKGSKIGAHCFVGINVTERQYDMLVRLTGITSFTLTSYMRNLLDKNLSKDLITAERRKKEEEELLQ